MAIPVINPTDSKQILEAMRQGINFKLKDGKTVYEAYSEQAELKKAEAELTAILERAENCKECISEEEFWARV